MLIAAKWGLKKGVGWGTQEQLEKEERRRKIAREGK